MDKIKLLENLPEKKIPPNIQIAIDKYISDHRNNVIEKPEVIYLNSINDFDCIKHENFIIEFPPGGEVGDREWSLQYMHNSSVLVEYGRKLEKIKEPFYAPETFIILDPSEVKSISTYIGDMLLDDADICMLHIANESFDIMPNVRDNVISGKKRYFINICIDTDTPDAKFIANYNDGRKEEIPIHICRY